MKIDVGEQRRDHSLNAKGNFCFERFLRGWRRRRCLTCDVSGSMLMSHGALDEPGEVRAAQRGTSTARSRARQSGSGRHVIARLSHFVATGIPVRGSGPEDEASAAGCRTVGADYVQNSKRRHPPITSVLFDQRLNAKRGRDACTQSIFDNRDAQAWLNGANAPFLMSVSTTSSTVCCSRNCNRATRFLCLTAPGLRASRRG
jgi:hypothetical protein